MKILYSNKKTESLCNDYKLAVRSFGNQTADKLMNLMVAIESFPNLLDLSRLPQYGLHPLKGNRDTQYSIVINKKTKWRLVIYPMDKDENKLTDRSNETKMLALATCVYVVEVSEHYA